MMKNTMRMAGILAAEMLFATGMAGAAAPVSAADHTTAAPGAAAAATQQAPAETAASAEAEASKQALLQEKEQEVPQGKEQIAPQGEEQAASQEKEHAIDIQMDYFEGHFFKERNIDLYNLHVFWQNRTVHHIKTYYGLTVERAVGCTTKDGIYRDSEAVGLGPAVQLRWERPLGGKFTGSIDGTGSLLLYNHAHPADGRAYGFLWRIGPRLTYHYTSRDAVSLAYMFHHSSNGMKDHNPGYNGVGFSLGYEHRF